MKMTIPTLVLKIQLLLGPIIFAVVNPASYANRPSVGNIEGIFIQYSAIYEHTLGRFSLFVEESVLYIYATGYNTCRPTSFNNSV